jgi:MerR family transcriptional regulator, light-induced transcriptional regulator
LLLYQYYLRSEGVSTVYLGPSLPYASLLEAIEVVKPETVITAWVTSVDGKYFKSYFERLVRDVPHLKITVGGFQAFEHGKQLPPSVKTFQSLDELLKQID